MSFVVNLGQLENSSSSASLKSSLPESPSLFPYLAQPAEITEQGGLKSGLIPIEFGSLLGLSIRLDVDAVLRQFLEENSMVMADFLIV